jgi:predicted PurR-regulated permease PerM
MRKRRMKTIVTIFLIALVFCLIFAPVTSSWPRTGSCEVSIFTLCVFLILFGVCFFPFTEIILSKHKLE